MLMNQDYDFFRTLPLIPFYRDDGDDFDDGDNVGHDNSNIEDLMMVGMMLMNQDYDFFRTLPPIPFYRDDDDFDDGENNVEDVMLMI